MTCKPHPTRKDFEPDWQIVRDVHSGERAVKDRGDHYLPRIGDMVLTGDPVDDADAQKEFNYYKMSARLTPYFPRTVSIYTGKISRKPSTVKLGGHAEMKEWALDVDGRGTTLESWLLKHVLSEALLVANYGVFVDSGAVLRKPVLRGYTVENIWNWNVEADALKWLLLRECGTEQTLKDGIEIEQTEFTRYRRLWMAPDGYRNDLYEESGDPVSKQQPLLNDSRMDRIPFFVLGACGSDIDYKRPPLLDMANVILDLYRLSAKQRRCFDLASSAAFYATGLHPDAEFEPRLGSMAVVTLPEASAKIGVTEYAGHALSEIMAEIKECQRLLVAIGAKMLDPESASNITAEVARLNNSADVNVLADIVGNLSKSVTTLLKYIARVWFKLDDSDVSFSFNLDFFEEAPNPQLLNVILSYLERDAIRLDDVFHHLQSVGLLEPTAERDQWIADIKAAKKDNEDIAAMLAEFGTAVSGPEDGDV